MGKKLLVAQSGGPTSAINATLAGVIEAAIRNPEVSDVLGARYGIQGVLREQFLSERFFGFPPGSVKGRAFTAQRSCNGLLLREDRWECWCRICKVRLEFARTHVL